jgi:hypothetical protein
MSRTPAGRRERWVDAIAHARKSDDVMAHTIVNAHNDRATVV